MNSTVYVLSDLIGEGGGGDPGLGLHVGVQKAGTRGTVSRRGAAR
jgi:hypothetical protein